MDKEIRKYIAAVRRRLNLPGAIRDRVISDVQTTVSARLEGGESWEEIRTSLGTPRKAAADLNEQMKEFAYRKSPWRFVFLAMAVLSGAWLGLYRLMIWLGQLLTDYTITIHTNAEQGGLGIIGGADGPTSIFVSTAVTQGRGIDWDIVIMAAILIVGIAGFLRLRKCRQK